MPFIENFVSQIFGGAMGQAAEAQRDPFMRSLMRWVGRMQTIAMAGWRPVMASGVVCTLRPLGSDGVPSVCREPAIGGCLFCTQAVCLHHAMVDEKAHVLCHKCVVEAGRRMGVAPKEAQPPPLDRDSLRELRQMRRRYLKVLGLEDPLEDGELDKAFKAMMLKNHPDRVRDPKDQEKAAKRTKEITEAYHWLKDHPGSARSAA